MGMDGKEPMDLEIQEEQPQDYEGIRQVNLAAFDGAYEAEVVERLRDNCPEICSLVGRVGDDVVGHILFSPVRIIQPNGQTVTGMGLGPVAVRPDHQGSGIGSALCHEGLQRMEAAGHPFVVVLGHPDYYPRFGFVQASTWLIKTAFKGVPEEAFMITILNPDVMHGVEGVAHYRQEFGAEA